MYQLKNGDTVIVTSDLPIEYSDKESAWHYIDPTGANSAWYVDPDKQFTMTKVTE
jgi:hypothetical protein